MRRKFVTMLQLSLFLVVTFTSLNLYSCLTFSSRYRELLSNPSFPEDMTSEQIKLLAEKYESLGSILRFKNDKHFTLLASKAKAQLELIATKIDLNIENDEDFERVRHLFNIEEGSLFVKAYQSSTPALFGRINLENSGILFYKNLTFRSVMQNFAATRKERDRRFLMVLKNAESPTYSQLISAANIYEKYKDILHEMGYESLRNRSSRAETYFRTLAAKIRRKQGKAEEYIEIQRYAETGEGSLFFEITIAY